MVATFRIEFTDHAKLSEEITKLTTNGYLRVAQKPNKEMNHKEFYVSESTRVSEHSFGEAQPCFVLVRAHE